MPADEAARHAGRERERAACARCGDGAGPRGGHSSVAPADAATGTRMGSVERQVPSRSWSAPATAPAVGYETDLADALDPVRGPRLGHLDEDRVDRRHVLRPDDPETAQRHVRGTPLFVGGEVLGEGVAEPHVHRPLDLTFAQQGVHGPADVVDRQHPVDLAGIPVDDDELGRVGEHRMDDRVLEAVLEQFVQSTRYSPS